MRRARPNHQSGIDILLGFAGFAFGAWIVGFSNLNPASFEWLRSDAKLAQIGHEFFWRAPWTQFPFNGTSSYGIGWHTNLNQSSQNSLIPLIFKPFASFFDFGFQIQGIWLSSCFAAQAIIARKIFAVLKLNFVAQVIGVIVVLLSPVLFSRIGTLWHPQLAAHWLILLAIYLYLNRSPLWMWLVLVPFSFSVHVYLCVIVTSVAVAALFNQRILGTEGGNSFQRVSSFIKGNLAVLAVLLISTALLGFGNFVGNPTTVGVGRYRLNVLSFINPGIEEYGFLLNSTEFFRNRSWLSEENEGFAYLGSGVLLSLVILFGMVVSKVLRIRRSAMPLIGVAALLSLVSLSDHIAVGSRDIAIPVPALLIEIRQTFRAATRFSWLAYYLLVIGGWYAVSRLASRVSAKSVSIVFLSMVALVQLIDVGPGVVALHRQIRDTRSDFAPDLAREWEPLLQSYQRVFIVPSVDANEDDVDLTDEERTWFEDDSLVQLAWLASISDVELNYSFCSRSCLQSARQSTEQVRGELSQLGPRDGSIYVFADVGEWQRFADESGAKSKVVGGLRVLLGPTSE